MYSQMEELRERLVTEILRKKEIREIVKMIVKVIMEVMD